MQLLLGDTILNNLTSNSPHIITKEHNQYNYQKNDHTLSDISHLKPLSESKSENLCTRLAFNYTNNIITVRDIPSLLQ